jgi:hypothetical protein
VKRGSSTDCLLLSALLVNLFHDSLRPLNGGSNHAPSARTVSSVEEVIRCLKVSNDQNARDNRVGWATVDNTTLGSGTGRDCNRPSSHFSSETTLYGCRPSTDRVGSHHTRLDVISHMAVKHPRARVVRSHIGGDLASR